MKFYKSIKVGAIVIAYSASAPLEASIISTETDSAKFFAFREAVKSGELSAQKNTSDSTNPLEMLSWENGWEKWNKPDWNKAHV